MNLRALALCILMTAVCTSAVAQLSEPTVQKFGKAGQRSFFGDFYAIEPDCSPVDWTEAKITQAPEHGVAELIERYVPISFPENSPRKSCNGRPTRTRTLTYTPHPDYKGEDTIKVEFLTSVGTLSRTTFQISVQ